MKLLTVSDPAIPPVTPRWRSEMRNRYWRACLALMVVLLAALFLGISTGSDRRMHLARWPNTEGMESKAADTLGTWDVGSIGWGLGQGMAIVLVFEARWDSACDPIEVRKATARPSPSPGRHRGVRTRWPCSSSQIGVRSALGEEPNSRRRDSTRPVSPTPSSRSRRPQACRGSAP